MLCSEKSVQSSEEWDRGSAYLVGLRICTTSPSTPRLSFSPNMPTELSLGDRTQTPVVESRGHFPNMAPLFIDNVR